MKLETNRLEIVPLNSHELKLITENINEFEKELNCKYCGEEMDWIILKIFKSQIPLVQNNSEDYLWHTFWLFKLKNEEKFIGSACFKSIPDVNGEVEIGYGINENYKSNGYTTEAVTAMCKWALKHSSVTKVLAETEKNNIQSQRVLEKCDMKIFKETEDYYWWSLTKDSSLR